MSIKMNKRDAMTETPQMDWQQVVLNGGPPCFAVEGDRYCGRAYRWDGHDYDHKFVSLDDLLNAERERCAKIAETAHLTKYFDTDLREEAGAEIAAAIRGSKQ